MTNQPVILFDGVCNLCNGFVQFVIRRDHKHMFRFGSLQSQAAQELLRPFRSSPGDLTSVVLLDSLGMHTESEAIVRIAKQLGGVWGLTAGLVVIPRPVRDAVYRFIASHRYRIFGQRETCMAPTPVLRERFIDEEVE